MNLFNILSSNFSTVTLLILLRSFSSSQVQVVVSAQGNFCGTSWVDAVTTCQRPCPSGAPSDCGGGETCFANTPVSLLRGCVDIMYDVDMTIFCKEIMRCALFFAINLMLPFLYHPIQMNVSFMCHIHCSALNKYPLLHHHHQHLLLSPSQLYLHNNHSSNSSSNNKLLLSNNSISSSTLIILIIMVHTGTYTPQRQHAA